jgi:hypothetical protein
MGRTPRTGRIAPSRASSPIADARERHPGSICLVATSSASAMGRSKPELALRSSAGARFTVTRLAGRVYPEFKSAAMTRSRLSFTAPEASPTIVQLGSPGATSTSTMTSQASMPRTVADRIDASMTNSASVRSQSSDRFYAPITTRTRPRRYSSPMAFEYLIF